MMNYGLWAVKYGGRDLSTLSQKHKKFVLVEDASRDPPVDPPVVWLKIINDVKYVLALNRRVCLSLYIMAADQKTSADSCHADCNA